MAIVMCFEPINADCAVLPYCVLRKALARARETPLSRFLTTTH